MVATGILHAIYYALLFRGYAANDLSSLYPLARGVGIIGVTIVSVTVFNAVIPFMGVLALAAIVWGSHFGNRYRQITKTIKNRYLGQTSPVLHRCQYCGLYARRQ